MSLTPAQKYKRYLEARRGYNFEYPNDEKWEKLLELGYEIHKWKNGRTDTNSVLIAKEKVEEYRKNNYYSRIVCFPNKVVRYRTYTVIFRKKIAQ